MGKISNICAYFIALQTLVEFARYCRQQSWRRMTEDIHCPAPQPEDHNHDEDPGFCKDSDIYIEFDNGVFYQASSDSTEVAITADYPRLYPFYIVSI